MVETKNQPGSYPAFCAALGIRPKGELESFYLAAEENGALEDDTCVSTACLERLKKDYELFSVFYREVLHAAQVIRANKDYLRYTNLLRLGVTDIRLSWYVPFIDPCAENEAVCFAPLFAVLAHVDDAEAEMVRRGIPKEMRLATHKAYETVLQNHTTMFGYPAMNSTMYFWSRHYIKPDLYPIGELAFEIMTMPDDAVILERLSDGSVYALRDCTDTGTHYVGQPVLRGGMTLQERQAASPDVLQKQEPTGADDVAEAAFSKDAYRICLQPGDDVISVHIPRGARIDAGHYTQDYRAALAFFRRHYPERRIKAITCHSWLMDPELAQCVKPGSNILDFQRYYRICPAKSYGKEVFFNVFYKPVERYEDLPETTSLERALKARYLQNKPIYSHRGIHLIEQEETL